MSYLLDTNVFLWSLSQPGRLNSTATQLLLSRTSRIFLSAATSWELSIKYALRKISLPSEPAKLIPQVLNDFGYLSLEIRHVHATAVSELPFHHRDPFDRLLVAQAHIENLTLMTTDRALARYDIQVLECGI